MLSTSRDPVPASDRLYRDANGLLMICMYCHRTRRNFSDEWDFVEAYVTGMPPRASHGIFCKACEVVLEAEIHIRQNMSKQLRPEGIYEATPNV